MGAHLPRHQKPRRHGPGARPVRFLQQRRRTGHLTVVLPPGAANGADRCTLQAANIPFNQYSETLNLLRFSMADIAGNLGSSPVYTVRTVSRNLRLSWSAVPGKTYRVQTKPSLASSTWTDLPASSLVATNTVATWTGTTGPAQDYYRIVLQRP